MTRLTRMGSSPYQALQTTLESKTFDVNMCRVCIFSAIPASMPIHRGVVKYDIIYEGNP